MRDILSDGIFKKSAKGLLILLSGIVLGYLALVLVYILPIEPMKKHIRESQSLLEAEGIQPVLVEGYTTTRLDNYSEGLFLNSAIYDGKESVWEKAAAIYQYRYGEEDYYHSLLKYLDAEPDVSVDSYERDWHGYLIYVKPLLLCMNYSDIRVINMALQIIAVIYLFFCMCKQRIEKYIPAFAMTLLFLTWGTLFFSLEYSALFYVFVMASIFILKKNEYILERKIISELFLLIGMIVSYIDVLTYPMLTIGIPLVFLFILNENWSKNVKSAISHIAVASFWWLCGYGGMWLGKWIIAGVILKTNVIKESILMALYRMSQTSGESGTMIEFTALEVLAKNFGVFFKPMYLIALACFGIWFIVKVIKFGLVISPSKIVAFSIVMCMPIVWYLALGNHSYIHYWMTHRSIALIVFAGTVMLIGMIDTKEGRVISHDGKEACRVI